MPLDTDFIRFSREMKPTKQCKISQKNLRSDQRGGGRSHHRPPSLKYATGNIHQCCKSAPKCTLFTLNFWKIERGHSPLFPWGGGPPHGLRPLDLPRWTNCFLRDTFNVPWEIWYKLCCKSTAESNSERIFKIGQHFSKVMNQNRVALFMAHSIISVIVF